jgi:AraC-like DNA-binding protein
MGAGSGEQQDVEPSAAWSTSEFRRRDRFAAYHDLVCHQFLRSVARTDAPDSFWADMDIAGFPDFQLVRGEVAAHEVGMTRRLIAQGGPSAFSALFPLSGTIMLKQNGRQAVLAPGDFGFWEDTSPGSLRFEEGARYVALRVPSVWAEALIAGEKVRDQHLGRRFDRAGAGGLVVDFVHGLTRLADTDPAQARLISRNVPALLGSVLAVAGGSQLDQAQTRALGRLQIIRYLIANLADPSLDADKVARAFNVSKRTLYRLLSGADGSAHDRGGEHPEESLHAVLRRLRVNRAARLMRSDPRMPLYVVARICGFGSEVTLHRSFLRLQGRTPSQYRSSLRQASGPQSAAT